MKIKNIFTSFSVIFLLFSCSAEDDNTNEINDQQSLIGTWDMIALNVQAEISGAVLGIPFISNTTSVGENFNYTLTFTETTYTAVGTYDIITTGTLNGVPIEETKDTIENESQSGTYEIIDGELRIDGGLIDLENITADIENVNLDPNFVTSFNENGDLVIVQTEEVTAMEDGNTFDISYDAQVIFRKQ